MFTNHAQVRNQQRCIPPIIHKWLNEYGDEIYDGHGGIKVFFSLRSKKIMERELGRHFVQEIKRYLSVYRIESSSSGSVITCGWKSRKFKK